MLFDLRGRGRRRTVKFVYIGLALLIGVGLIGFGVGGGLGGGGLLTAASNNEGSGSASFSKQIKKYRRITQREPNNLVAWEKLTENQLHEAGGEAFVSNGQVTEKGKELFSQAAESWNHYLALNPPKPSAKLAQQMLRLFSEEGLNQPAAAVQVLQIVVEAKPTSVARWSELAIYAYKAKNTRVGDLAAAKAIGLAPANERVRLKNEFAEVKKSPSGSGQTYTTTTNGKTYTGKLGASGTLKAKEVKTTTTK